MQRKNNTSKNNPTECCAIDHVLFHFDYNARIYETILLPPIHVVRQLLCSQKWFWVFLGRCLDSLVVVVKRFRLERICWCSRSGSALLRHFNQTDRILEGWYTQCSLIKTCLWDIFQSESIYIPHTTFVHEEILLIFPWLWKRWICRDENRGKWKIVFWRCDHSKKSEEH